MDHEPGVDVLIVEDDADIREMLMLAVRQVGYLVAAVATGREALDQLLRTRAPRLILLDLVMPDMDGWTFLMNLRRMPWLVQVPVVVTSAVAAAAERNPGLEVAAFLNKPFDVELLLATLERFAPR